MTTLPIFPAIIISIGFTFAVYAGDEGHAKPAQDASSNTAQNLAGKIPPEIEKVIRTAMQMPNKTHEEQVALEKVINPAILEWIKQDPTVVIDWALQLPPEFNRQYLHAIGKCGEIHGKITEDWLLKKKRYGALHYAMHYWANADPLPAAEWCMQAPTEVHHIAFASLGDGWTYKDPAASTAWFLNLKSTEDRRSMAHGICKAWTWHQRDAVGATAWALGLKSKEDRLSAIFGIGQGWCRYDVPALTAWIKTLKNRDEVRSAAYATVKEIQKKNVKNEFGETKDFSKEWLQQLPLNDEERTCILNGKEIDMKVVGKIQWPE